MGPPGAPQAPKSGPSRQKMWALCSSIITESIKTNETVPALKNNHITNSSIYWPTAHCVLRDNLQHLLVAHSATSCLHPPPLEGVVLCLWGGRRCPPSPPSTWMDPLLLLLLHHHHHHPLHSSVTMTARMTSTAVTVESVLFSAKNTMDVIAGVKMAWT